jgi:hypothetical protein
MYSTVQLYFVLTLYCTFLVLLLFLFLQVRDLLVPLVQPWIPLVCSVLASDPSARAAWPTKLAALRLGQALANYFSKPLAAAMPQLMGAAWQLLLAFQPLHQSLLVEGHEGDGAEDAAADATGDDELVGLEPLLAQASDFGLLEFLGSECWRRGLGCLRSLFLGVMFVTLSCTRRGTGIGLVVVV